MLATTRLHFSALPPVATRLGERAAACKLTPLNRTLCERLALISPYQAHRERANAIEHLHQTFADRLCRQWRALGPPVREGKRDEEARHLRHNRSLTVNLWALLEHGPRLLRTFAPVREGGHSIRASCPSLGKLRAESRQVFATAVEQKSMRTQALAYAAVIDPRAHASLGIELTKPEDHRKLKDLQVQARGGLLDALSVLQLRDYAHADTGSFNFYRAVDLLKDLAPDAGCGALFEDLIDGLHGSVNRLWAVEAARVNGPISKGWITTRALPLQSGSEFDIRRPWSATARASSSYLLRQTPDLRRYDVDLQLSAGAWPHVEVRAVHFAVFNSPKTVDEDEVLVLPGQRFRVLKVLHEDVRDHSGMLPVTRCRAQRVPSQAASL